MKKAVNLLVVGWVIGGCATSLLFLPTKTVAAAPALAFVTGTVKDDAGVPLVGAVVALCEAQPRGKELKTVKTDGDGKFLAGIVPGVYRLRAYAEGFTPMFTRINLDRAVNLTHHFALRRTDTLVQKRGDRDDYRWIGRSVPRHVLNVVEEIEDESVAAPTTVARNGFTDTRPQVRGLVQFLAAGATAHGRTPGGGFYGTNFALSGTFGGGVEMAVIGQRGYGDLAPQRLTAVATMRPAENHHVTASVGYGQMALARKFDEFDPLNEPSGALIARSAAAHVAPSASSGPRSLDQISVSATDSWQVFRPLLIIYGFDYSRFISSAASQQDSVLPRIAVQYSPSARWRMNAAVTPSASRSRETVDGFESENLQVPFETRPTDAALLENPMLDRSLRYETGIERIFGDGSSSLEASIFYDVISGHGVGVLALPLEASPETQAAMQQVAHQVAAMNGAARGTRLMYGRRFNDYVTASVGYSFGAGSRFNGVPVEQLTPGRLFQGGFFQVASAKLDLDLSPRTGTRISTVVRLSPSAVVFAIDPFAGRMSVYDPNINIYVTQELPNFGLPLRWQALVDIRNLLNQINGVEEGAAQLIALHTRRTVRGGIAFRW